MTSSTETLHDCPQCGTKNFTARGLATHNCAKHAARRDASLAVAKTGAVTGEVEVLPPERDSHSARVEQYHQIARSCAAYAVFYGAMAGQELIAFRQQCGGRKFQTSLEESMPWLPRSTAYLYIGYAEKFAERLASICPTVGQMDLATLPDPRDYAAAEKTDLFAQVRKNTNATDAGQMWLALGLMRETKPRGGARVKDPDKTYDPNAPLENARDLLLHPLRAIMMRWREKEAKLPLWTHLPPEELREIDGILLDLRTDLKAALKTTKEA